MEPIVSNSRFAGLTGENTAYAPEWNLLPDEMILEIFNKLNIFERNPLHSLSTRFEALASDYTLLNTEAKQCQKLVSEFIAKNKNHPLEKKLSAYPINWANPYQAIKTVGALYIFDKTSPSDLAKIDPPCVGEVLPSLTKSYHERLYRSVKNHLYHWKGKCYMREGVGQCYRIEDGWKFSDESFKIFLKALSESPQIVKLVILCNLTSVQLLELAESLKNQKIHLKNLDIRFERGWKLNEVEALAEAISENKEIKTISLLRYIDDLSLRRFSTILDKNNSLEEVQLCSDGFNIEGFSALIELLTNKPNIKKLTIVGELPDLLVRELFRLLDKTQLEELTITGSKISDTTADIFVTHLAVNKNLQFTDLKWKDTESDVSEKIAVALKRHNSQKTK